MTLPPRPETSRLKSGLHCIYADGDDDDDDDFDDNDSNVDDCGDNYYNDETSRQMIMMQRMIRIKVMIFTMIMIITMITMITMMSRACGNIGTTFEALKQHSTATTYHEQVSYS